MRLAPHANGANTEAGPMILAMLWFLLMAVPGAPAETTLPGTKPYTFTGDPASGMVDAIRAYLMRETAASADRRAEFQKLDIASRRERFRHIIGAVDVRVPFAAPEL